MLSLIALEVGVIASGAMRYGISVARHGGGVVELFPLLFDEPSHSLRGRHPRRSFSSRVLSVAWNALEDSESIAQQFLKADLMGRHILQFGLSVRAG